SSPTSSRRCVRTKYTFGCPTFLDSEKSIFQPDGSTRQPVTPERPLPSAVGGGLGAARPTRSASAVTSPPQPAPRPLKATTASRWHSLSPAACARSPLTATRFWQAPSPREQSRAGSGALHHRDGDVPRNGHDLLAGAGHSGNASAPIAGTTAVGEGVR